MADDKKTLHWVCLAVYAVFLVSCVMQFSVTAILVASAVMMLALFVAHGARGKAKGTIYDTHLQWAIRTFWIGGAVYLPVITVAASIIMFGEMDRSAMMEAAESGTVATPMELAEILVKSNMGVFTTIYMSLFLPFTAWWIYRCIAGIRRLLKDEAMPDPVRWI